MQAQQGGARGHGLVGNVLARPHCSWFPSSLLPVRVSPSTEVAGPTAHCRAWLPVGWARGSFWLQCAEPPTPHTAPKAPKAIKQWRKNDSGRGNEPQRKLTRTQGAARLSADREGRLPHKTKHLNSPLYNNYSAWMPLPLPGLLRVGAGAQEKGWSKCGCPSRVPLARRLATEPKNVGRGIGDQLLQPPHVIDEKPGDSERVCTK